MSDILNSFFTWIYKEPNSSIRNIKNSSNFCQVLNCFLQPFKALIRLRLFPFDVDDKEKYLLLLNGKRATCAPSYGPKAVNDRVRDYLTTSINCVVTNGMQLVLLLGWV